MRINRNLLIFILAASLISGCGESELKKEINALKRDVAERRAEIEYLERQAAIAAACDYILRLCPDSVADTGRQAQKGGFGGGSVLVFWLAVAAKMAAVGSLMGAAVAVWTHFGRPAAEEIERARQLIRDAEVAQARSDSQEKAHQERLIERMDEIKHAADELERFQLETAAAAQLLHRHLTEIESLKAAKSALSAFH